MENAVFVSFIAYRFNCYGENAVIRFHINHVVIMN